MKSKTGKSEYICAGCKSPEIDILSDNGQKIVKCKACGSWLSWFKRIKVKFS